jgi:hypothetical protein
VALALKLFTATNHYELQGGFFFASCHSQSSHNLGCVKSNRKNSPLPKSSKKSAIYRVPAVRQTDAGSAFSIDDGQTSFSADSDDMKT